MAKNRPRGPKPNLPSLGASKAEGGESELEMGKKFAQASLQQPGAPSLVTMPPYSLPPASHSYFSRYILCPCVSPNTDANHDLKVATSQLKYVHLLTFPDTSRLLMTTGIDRAEARGCPSVCRGPLTFILRVVIFRNKELYQRHRVRNRHRENSFKKRKDSRRWERAGEQRKTGF